MSDFDSEIDKAHRQAQDAESRAVVAMERMRQIPGMTTIVDKMPRRFGQAPNPYAPGSSNLTAASMLERHDPALAHHLATLVGATIGAPDYAAKAKAEAKAAEVERMRQATARAAAENELHRRARERASLAGVQMLTGRRLGQ